MKKPQVTFCKSCTFPSSSAVPLEFNDEGICSGCLTENEGTQINWKRRENLFKDLINEYKSPSNNYDCIIPVSGGKDSYFIIDMVKNKLGMKPLLVSYNKMFNSKEGIPIFI